MNDIRQNIEKILANEAPLNSIMYLVDEKNPTLSFIEFFFSPAIKYYRHILTRYAGPQISKPLYDKKLNDPIIQAPDRALLEKCLNEALQAMNK